MNYFKATSLMLAILSTSSLMAFTTFTGRVLKTESCKANNKQCRDSNKNLGEQCQVKIKFTGQKSGLTSRQYSNGSKSMNLVGKPIGRVDVKVAGKNFSKFYGEKINLSSATRFDVYISKNTLFGKSKPMGNLVFLKNRSGRSKLRELIFIEKMGNQSTYYTCGDF